jgi:hypothetical protein
LKGVMHGPVTADRDQQLRPVGHGCFCCVTGGGGIARVDHRDVMSGASEGTQCRLES